ncbi:RNA helicase [Skermanella sp. TT6]|uniref:RNA helicase n=1 Tax=Skermanella cutis TaxID=2775420 RepID=A0ABX7BC91_9PROT|nr:SUV3 C-terminal domain-containing protein [Skermanella sp. TT6]QQP91200.1 RNA helicase [Skermanella sp. TT6]
MAEDSDVQDLPGDADPHLIHEIARRHPDCLTLAEAGIARMEMAAASGLTSLGLPLPKGKRDLLVPIERRDAVMREIQGHLDRAKRRNELLAASRRALDPAGHVSLHPGDGRDRVRLVMTDALPWTGMEEPIRFAVSRQIDVDEFAGLDEAGPGHAVLRDRLVADGVLAERLHADAARLAERLWRYADEAGTGDDGWTFGSLCDRLGRTSRNHQDADEILRRWDREFDAWRRDRAEARGRAFIDRHFDFSRYELLFPVARGMGRRLVLVVGPTNSGKTHRALEALRGASSGVYLAPLRLLALEVMDRLNRDGTPTTLLTGEEEIRTPDARHVASTIEMMDPERPVDVAVIDEVQMLADPDRGWAWTAALIGAPADTVYLLGAPEARPLVERVAAYLGEPLEVVELQRKAPLSMIPRRLEWTDVEAGDALIAFSRRDVHLIRDAVHTQGLTAAVLYGALAPDVRRLEAERFLSGLADVVVATDAIGMGLNLPVRRVLFTALEKFDGTAVRPLSPVEIRQIAGRAGRFGQFEAGEFGVVARNTPQALKTLMERTDARLGPQASLAVRPTRGMLARLAEYSGATEMALLIDWFAAARTAGSLYRIGDLGALRRLAQLLDERSLGFPDKLSLLFIPADLEKEAEMRLFRAILQAVETAEPMPIGHVVPGRIEGLDDQALEDLSRACDLYYWAARRFRTLFPDRDAVRERRALIGSRLGDLLASRARREREPKQSAGSPGKAGKPKAGFRGAPRKRFGPRRR